MTETETIETVEKEMKKVFYQEEGEGEEETAIMVAGGEKTMEEVGVKDLEEAEEGKTSLQDEEEVDEGEEEAMIAMTSKEVVVAVEEEEVDLMIEVEVTED